MHQSIKEAHCRIKTNKQANGNFTIVRAFSASVYYNINIYKGIKNS